MPPKKKATKLQPSRKKEPVKQNEDSEKEAEASPIDRVDDVELPGLEAEASEDPEKKQIRWAKPKTTWMPTSEYKPWALALFGRPWEGLERAQMPSFDRPHLISPLYQEEAGKKKPSVPLNDSQHLRSLYQEVQVRREDYFDGIDNENDGMLELGLGSPVPLAGDRYDGNLAATLKLDNENEQTASVQIIRRTLTEKTPAEHFVVVPLNTTVTVNGTTYRNEEPGECNRIFIGPLGDFAIIELLHTPLFLWKNRQGTLSRKKGKPPKGSQSNERVATLTFLPIPDRENGDSQPSSGSDSGGSSSKRPHGDRPNISNPSTPKQNNGSALAHGEPSNDAPDDNDQHNSDQDNSDQDNSDQDNSDQDNSDQSGQSSDKHPGSSQVGRHRSSSRSAHPTDPVEDQQETVPYNNTTSLEDVVNPVLLAISRLQQDKSVGFCIETNDTLLRPGQPWILPIRPFRAAVLLVLHCVKPPQPAEGLRIKILVLDPLKSDSDPAARRHIWDTASGSSILQRWMAGIGFTLEELETALPDSIQWVDSPIALNKDEASMITILNAWAIAMGLELNPDWVPRHDASNSSALAEDDRDWFFQKARRLFGLSLSGRNLNYEVVHQFLESHNYVIGEQNPDGDRLFNLNDFPTDRLIYNQIEAQKKYDQLIARLRSASSEKQSLERKKSLQRTTFLKIKLSKLSRKRKFSSTPSENPRKRLKSLPDDSKETGPHLTQKEKQDKEQKEGKAVKRSKEGHSYPEKEHTPKRVSSLSMKKYQVFRDTSDFPEAENPCGYLAKRMKQLAGLIVKKKKLSQDQMDPDEGVENIDEKTMLRSIASVAQAVAHAEGRDRSLECIDYAAVEADAAASAIGYKRNRLLILPGVTDNRSDGPFWDTANRPILVAVQPLAKTERWMHAKKDEKNNGEKRQFLSPSLPHEVEVAVFDYAPWLSNAATRKKTFDELRRRLYSMSGQIGMRRETYWCDGPPLEDVQEQWKFKYYVILHAWTLALRLELNTAFRPREGFFNEAYKFIDLVLRGMVDWKLVWSFLRCHEFVQGSKRVQKRRRFDRTVSEKMLRQSHSRLFDEYPELLPATMRRKMYQNIGQGRNLGKFNIPTDTWEGRDDFELAMPLLSRARFQVSRMTQQELRALKNIYFDERPSSSAQPSGTQHLRREASDASPDPCEGFREELGILKKIYENGIAHASKGFGKPGLWLLTEDVGRAIASVTLAITMANNQDHGYSYFSPAIVEQICNATEEYPEMLEDLQPERAIGVGPIVVPVQYDNHIMLLIIQLDEHSKQSQLLILDSRAWYWSKKERKNIYNIAVQILLKSRWGARDVQIPSEVPKHAMWIDCAMQDGTWACGFYTTFNGWAAALGLKVNPKFRKDWDDDTFRQEATDVVSLAIIGRASLKLIKGFLDCSQFILPGQTIDGKRHFDSTTRNFNRSEGDLEDSLEVLRNRENGNPQYNILDSTSGRPHNTTWPKDGWKRSDSWSRSEEPFYSLSTAGRLRPDMDVGQLNHVFLLYSEQNEPEDSKINNVLSHFKEHRFQDTNDKSDAARQLRDYLGLDSLDLRLVNGRPGYIRVIFLKYLIKFLSSAQFEDKMIVRFGKGQIKLSWDLQIASIAAIVQAIDSRQADKIGETEKPFAGGLALFLSEGEIFNVPASRPRRCWLMPYQFSGQDASGSVVTHNTLAVLQEEVSDSGEARHIRVYFLDSQPKYLLGRLEEIYGYVRTVAQGLRWSTHRNGVEFHERPRVVKVTRQLGGTTCGFHTILNAWILALGLTPKLHPKMPEPVYKHIGAVANLALAGALDWKVLVAWLFNWKLTIETKAEAVPENRRFSATAIQTRQSDEQSSLRDYIETTSFTDTDLANHSEEVAPYDFRNNVDFSSGNWEFEPEQEQEQDEEQEQDQDQDEDEDHVLNRLDEDMDDLGYMDFRPDLQYCREIAEREWEERKYHERCARRSRWLQNMRNQQRPSGIRRRGFDFL